MFSRAVADSARDAFFGERPEQVAQFRRTLYCAQILRR